MLRLIIFVLILFPVFLYSHDGESKENYFIENKGQWNEAIQYKTNVRGGEVSLLNNGFFFNLYDLSDISRYSHERHVTKDLLQFSNTEKLVDCHAYKMNFKGASFSKLNVYDASETIYNYFIGKEDNWASNVLGYEVVELKNLYSFIDAKTYNKEGQFKYDLIVKPGGNVNDIQMEYMGVDGIRIEDGKLMIKTSFTDVIESMPVVYQLKGDKQVLIQANYVIVNGIVKLQIGDYDKSKDLIIDPVVVASTYSGATEEIYGHTGTFDEQENIFSAGACFSPGGSPTTLGAYQQSYQGGREIVVNKYNPNGNQLIYCTYLGGGQDDYPHSLYNFDGKLYLLGSTDSDDFPTTSSAYDRIYNGNTDIIVSVLSQDGSSLLASTYVGGNYIDGQNFLSANYGDTYRGEIIVDNAGNAYVASMSSSTNFPVTAGVIQSVKGADQDGVVFKLNSNLSALSFSTFIGGAGDDAAYGLIEFDNKIYATGVIASNSINASSGAYTSNSGNEDGYIIALNSNATNLIHATYFGINDNDRSFFIEKDNANNIYILGQSDGNLTSAGAVYSRGYGTFVARFSEDLGTHQFTSTIEDLSPIAFLVDECGFIYVSGHGGTTTLSGFEVTPTAVQSSGAGFYLMVLDPDAAALNYATYYGSATSHVDGGTSRFDKRGVVYQATCTDGGFPTLSDAYATSNLSGTYDVTVFKIAFEVNAVKADFELVEYDGKCSSNTIIIKNNSQGKSYFWDFGDGTTSTDYEPQHTYTEKGNYEIKLLVKDESYACILPDSAREEVNILKIGGDQNIFIPNSFTPDNDGRNDLFGAVIAGEVEEYKLQIFNRWGDLVFETISKEETWDGKTINSYGENEVYVYRLSYKDECSNKKIHKIGHITVLR